LVLLWSTAIASGGNWIRQWNPNLNDPEHPKYEIRQGEYRVIILEGSTEIFKFEAYDPDTQYPEAPGLIRSIEGSVGGLIRLMVAGDQGRPFGARDVEQISLGYEGASIEGLWISGDLGNDYLSTFGHARNVSIGGNLLSPLHSTSDVTGFTVSGTLGANVTCASLANVDIFGTGTHTGNLTVGSGYAGRIRVYGAYGGNMSFAGSLSGQVLVDAPLSGQITVNGALLARPPEDPISISVGSLTSTGTINVHGPAAGALSVAGDTTGTIQIDDALSGQIAIAGALLNGPAENDLSVGSMTTTGAIHVTGPASAVLSVAADMGGTIEIDGALTGQIRINGSLLNGPAENDIAVGSMPTETPPTNAIVIDYDGDGWQSGDRWYGGPNGAHVAVGTATYDGNSPAERIYEITPCKGDMNNDGSVDDADISGFNTARMDPDAYAEAFPGLAGSMIFHGDLGGGAGGSCDGFVDDNDIAPFNARRAAPCCAPNCGACPPVAAC
jgi:hypothetical protein